MTERPRNSWSNSNGPAWISVITKGGITALLALTLFGVYQLTDRMIDVVTDHLKEMRALEAQDIDGEKQLVTLLQRLVEHLESAGK